MAETLDTPAILLPLRLELRKVRNASGNKIKCAKLSFVPPSGGEQAADYDISVHEDDVPRPEYWIRWYPDELHHLTPVGKITEKDNDAWEKLLCVLELNPIDSKLPLSVWNELVKLHSSKADSWRTFCKEAGTPARALQIIRNKTKGMEGKWDFDRDMEETDPLEIFMSHGMQIRTMPERVSLYTMKSGEVKELVKEIAVKNGELFIAAADTEQSLWTADFDEACAKGMGIRIADSGKVIQVDEADWLIVVGLGKGSDSRKAFEEILSRNISRGRLSFFPQDSQTNNSEGAKAPSDSPEADAYEYLKRLEPEFTSPIQEGRPTDAQNLSEAFKTDGNILEWIPGSASQDDLHAGAMCRLLWDICLRQFSWKDDQIVKENWMFLKKLFVENVRAAGPFPILRVGSNPYGILPVQSSREGGAPGAEQPYSRQVSDFLLFLKANFLSLAEQVPKLDRAPEEDQYETLLDIMETERLSTHVDVRPIGRTSALDLSADARNCSCQYVRDALPGETNTELKYLKAIARHLEGIDAVLSQLRDPADFPADKIAIFKVPEVLKIDGNSPLLKRMLVSLLHLLKKDAEALLAAKRDARWIQDALRLSSCVKDAKEGARICSGLPCDTVEILFLETLDLFSYRLDAWITGFATERLRSLGSSVDTPVKAPVLPIKPILPISPDKPVKPIKPILQYEIKPPIGIFGWLEKPGAISGEIAPYDARYIQAPSEIQAVTAALLRNASLQNGTEGSSGIFSVNLSSDRVRQGLVYLQGLRKGFTCGELLGYELERLVRELAEKNWRERGTGDPGTDKVSESDLYELRNLFPMATQRNSLTSDGDGNTCNLTLVDGERFIAECERVLESPALKDKKNQLEELKSKLAQLKDAAADIATAETVYQYLSGKLDAAAAWMKFIDGDLIPPEPEFIYTPRSGERLGTKVTMVVDGVDAPRDNEKKPRVIADPLLASLCDAFMTSGVESGVVSEFKPILVLAKIKRVDGYGAMPDISFSLKDDLNLEPIDLYIGGKPELALRLRHYALRQWAMDAESFRPLGDFPEFSRIDEPQNLLSVEWSDVEGCEDLAGCFSQAERLKRLLQSVPDQYNGTALQNENIPFIDQIPLGSSDGELAGTYTILNSRISVLWQLFNGYLGNDIFRLLRPLIAFFLPALNLVPSLNALKERIKGGAPASEAKLAVGSVKKSLAPLAVGVSQEANPIISALDALIAALSEATEADLIELVDGTIETQKTALGALEESILGRANGGLSDTAILLNEIGRAGIDAAFTPLPGEIKKEDLPKLGSLLSRVAEALGVKLSYLSTTDVPEGKAGIPILISKLQQATDGKALTLVLPYYLADNSPFTAKSGFRPPREDESLEVFEKVRPAIKNCLRLARETRSSRMPVTYVYEPAPSGGGEDAKDRFTHYVISIGEKAEEWPFFAYIPIDAWQEFVPDDTQTTGVAYRYESPKAEAPNVIILAVPPASSTACVWDADMLADTVAETIELAQIRSVTTRELLGQQLLGKFFPLLVFEPDNEGNPLAPSSAKCHYRFGADSRYVYAAAASMSAAELAAAEGMILRTENPESGGG